MSRPQATSHEARQHVTTSTSGYDSSRSTTLISSSSSLRNYPTIANGDFSYSAPYERRSYVIFGDGGDEEDLIMSRSSLRTPVDIKREISEAEKNGLAAAMETKGRIRRRKSDTISATPFIDPLDRESSSGFLKGPLKEGELHSSQSNRRKKLKKVSAIISSPLSQITHGPIGKLNQNHIDAELEIMSSFNRNKIEIKKKISGSNDESGKILMRADYFGLESRRKFNSLFLNANNDSRLYPTEEDLPESRRTPHTLYLRGLAEKNLNPLPLTIRKESTPYDVSLAHR